MDVKIGITGHGGFIGGSVFRAVRDAGHSAIPLDDFTRSLTFEDNETEEYPAALDWVLHFGAKTSIRDGYDHPYETYANNIGSTLVALRIAQHSHAAFLFMSSYVYGWPVYVPIDERHPVVAVNPYMGSKIIGEEMCRQISDMQQVPAVILRGFNIFGDHYIAGRLICDLLDAVRWGKTIHLNDPAPLRDYLYIKDFIALIMKIITQAPVATGTYNVGYGQSYSNLEVAELVSRLTNRKLSLIVQSDPRPNDIPDCSVDSNLIKRTFSWEPEYPLQRALSELIADIQSGRTNEPGQ